MKKIIFATIIILTSAISAFAQKNSVLLYGNLNVTSNTNASGAKNTLFGITPGIGYQFSNHITLGVNIGYTTTTATPAGGSSLPSVNTFSTGPFIRYSCPIAGVFSFFTQFNTDYTNVSQSNAPTVSGFDAKLYPAFCANIKNGIALIFSFASVSYASNKASGASASNSNFGLNFGSGATFGISKHFGGK